MTELLLAERVPATGRVLVVGAGGGLETKCFAQAHAGWAFDGVDPSADMLALATDTLGPLAARVALHHGTIAVAPKGPFDAATCLLTFHFLKVEERRQTLADIHRRLKPGAPLVVAHLSCPQDGAQRDLWLSRYEDFIASFGTIRDRVAARTAMDQQLTILAPQQDEDLLRAAGFSDVSLFYAGFAFRGWVATA